MRFIRKNGRVIPIRDRVARGIEKGAPIGALAVGSTWALLDAAAKKSVKTVNPFGIAFWGLKGAIAGGVIGGLTSAPWRQTPAPKVTSENTSEIRGAFKRSFVLGTIGTLGFAAKPFLRNPVAKRIADKAFWVGHVGSTTNAFASAAAAKKGNKGKVLAAGGAGDVAAANLLRLMKPVLRNRARLGLRRFG